VRVRVTGELDLSSSPQLEEVLRHEIAESRDVLLDLSHVQFIDSTGVHAILVGVRESQANGSDLRISRTLPPQPLRLFELVGLLDTLPLVDDGAYE
jgi:anti-sigma B factor antagonist